MKRIGSVLAGLLALCGSASAQTVVTPGATLSIAMTVTTANNVPTNRSAAVNVTATDPAGITSIVVYDAGAVNKTCTASPCATTIAWAVGTTPHPISAVVTMKTGSEVHTAQIQYPN